MFTALIVAATLGMFLDEAVLAQPKPDLAAYNEATARVSKSGGRSTSDLAALVRSRTA